jgi:hypothetical protein
MERGFYVLKTDEVADRPFLAYCVPSTFGASVFMLTIGRAGNAVITGRGMTSTESFGEYVVKRLEVWDEVHTFMVELVGDVLKAPDLMLVGVVENIIHEYFSEVKSQGETEYMAEHTLPAPRYTLYPSLFNLYPLEMWEN